MPKGESKVCECGTTFYRENRVNDYSWSKRSYCSRGCYDKYRRRMPREKSEQSRDNSRRAMNKHWSIRQAKLRKATVGSRAEEQMAIAEYLAKVGATQCEAASKPSSQFVDQRPAVQAAWRS